MSQNAGCDSKPSTKLLLQSCCSIATSLKESHSGAMPGEEKCYGSNRRILAVLTAVGFGVACMLINEIASFFAEPEVTHDGLARTWSELAAAAGANAEEQLASLMEDFYQWHMEQAPEFSTIVGETAHNHRLTDLSLESLDQQCEKVQEFESRLVSIDKDRLSRKGQYDYDVLKDTLTSFTDNYFWRHHGCLSPLNFMDAFYLLHEYYDEITPFDTEQDYENFICRIKARPKQIEQTITRMRRAIQLGTTCHWASVKDVPDQIAVLTSVDPQRSVLYQPFRTRLERLQLPDNTADDLRKRAVAAIQEVWKAMLNLSIFIAKEYVLCARSSFGVHGMPEGKAYYRACLRWHISMDLTPEQVHQTGLREVARICELMKQDEILQRYDEIIKKRIYPRLNKLFKDIPSGHKPLYVRALPYDGPYGSYWEGTEDGKRPGIFYANVTRPEETLTFSMMSLALHEAVPGHHLQFMYQVSAEIPKFLKHIEHDRYYAVPYHFPFYTAYTEGWGLYAEYLGEELDLYADDYELMGRYGEEICRACRLVVDTGLHFLGWSRKKCIDYLKSYTPMSRSEVEIEVDRYITWPGQACAYKIGEMKIKQLREKASTALGEAFDVGEFHSLVLKCGPVPLTVLERIVLDYIRDKGANPAHGQSSIFIG